MLFGSDCHQLQRHKNQSFSQKVPLPIEVSSSRWNVIVFKARPYLEFSVITNANGLDPDS